MDKDAAIQKIKKCLALSKSPNPHEAAAALRQAQKLMEAHQIDEGDIDLSCVAEYDVTLAAGIKSAWLTLLARTCSNAFGCDFIFKAVGDGNRATFIGVHGAEQVAGYAFQVLLRQVQRDRTQHIALQPKACKRVTKIARGDAFALGWVRAAAALVSHLAGQEAEQVARAALIEHYKQRQFINLKSFTPVRRDLDKKVLVSPNSYLQGESAGRAAQLTNAVGAKRQALLAGHA